MDIKIEKIIRSKKKSIALQITESATLIVKAPLNVNDEVIRKTVLRHKRWIERRIKEAEERKRKLTPKEFVNGEGFLYLGRSYKLRIVERQKEPLKLENKFYLSKKFLPRAREVFIEWYKKMAYEKISERVEWYAKMRGFKYNKINITNAQRKWGSCSYLGNLNFPWRLVMAPLSVIDYVVAHELVHLEDKSHSKSFWTKVKMLLSDYEKSKDWLKKNGYLLRL
jgi:hypothetical protein